ncbi:hypothetical protein [Dorea sp. D27]|uniref:hypothetical protein n=1 Tax=Dorea sp. D27 TaxID=658665 RepID=UPI000673C080|nr:hypothetical protein [Dorea sp. D27]KMZ52571.1 30 kDA salivary gland allergen Aed a 3 [Dorea sp. D27]
MSEEIKSEELTGKETAEKIESAVDIAADDTGSAEKPNTTEGTGNASEKPETEAGKPTMEYEEAYQRIYKDILEHLRSFSPSDEIAYRITEEHITEYLEGSRQEKHQEYKERRDKRLLSALKLIAILVCIIMIVWFLKDSQAILVNILYIIGGLIALWIWKYPHNKDE